MNNRDTLSILLKLTSVIVRNKDDIYKLPCTRKIMAYSHGSVVEFQYQQEL